MNKYSIINLYKKRSEIFTERTITMLERINFVTDYNKKLDDFYKKLLDAGCDEDIAADNVMNFSDSLADEYMLLSDGIYSAILTGFYHLWERDIKDLCKRLLLRNPVDKGNKRVTEQMVQSYKYDNLKKLLIFWSAEESNFYKVNLLRLIVNTIKHSAGPSSVDLLNTNSKYYYKLAMLCDLKINAPLKDSESIMLGIDDLKYFGVALSRFWTEIGEKILI